MHSPVLSNLPDLPYWQFLIVIAPALVMAATAVLAGRDVDLAWQRVRLATKLTLGLAGLGVIGLLLVGDGARGGLRADLLAYVMTCLVAFVGWVIVRYSRTYLAGEPGQVRYVRWLAAVLASVLLVVVSNNIALLVLAWMATSLSLHRLLTFYEHRPTAVLVAHKKFIVSRLADILMIIAGVLLVTSYGTLQIDQMLALASAQTTAGSQLAAVLIVLAVMLKCAQLPFHGWLIQVMEAPTPVSALLHAGIVNLGGFVLMRFASLLSEVTAAMSLLVVAGTVTAVIAALVMTTRVSIKVMLAWSTCAQMGFMILQCGLGLWGMALLHLVAHSCYKAFAFLNANSIVQLTMTRRLRSAREAAPPTSLMIGAVVAAVVTMVAGALVTQRLIQHEETASLFVMAIILSFALVPLLVAGFGDRSHARGAHGIAVYGRAAAVSFALAIVYFALHALLHGRVAPPNALPEYPLWWFVGVSFIALFVLQSIVFSGQSSELSRRLYPWFYGGFFLDEKFNRLAFKIWPLPKHGKHRPHQTKSNLSISPDQLS